MQVFFTDRRRAQSERFPLPPGVDARAVYERLGITDRVPFILGSNGEYDFHLNRWLIELPDRDSRSRRGAGSPNTWSTYAYELLTFARWLEDERDGKSIWEADEEDVRAFRLARTQSDDPADRVDETSWKHQLGTLTRFYDDAVEDGLVSRNPCVVGRRRDSDDWVARRGYNRSSTPGERPCKFLSLDQYFELRDVGLRGGEHAGRRVHRRQGNRNVAAANLVVSTGIRLEEFTSLLRADLPASRDQGARGHVSLFILTFTAKGNRTRQVDLPVRYLREVEDYIDIERRVAVQRARARGAYEARRDWLFIEGIEGRGEGARVIPRRGRPYPLGRLTVAERRRLFVGDLAGGEPAALWLNERGMPQGYEGWKSVMKRASSSCRRRDAEVFASWHTLRHTFAVHTLAALIAEVFGPNVKRFDPRADATHALMVDPLRYLQQRLGHVDDRTTTNWYLANGQAASRLGALALARFAEALDHESPAAMVAP